MLEVVERVRRPECEPGELLYRFPEYGQAYLRLGSQIIVGERQCAVLFRSGRALDVFDFGEHTLTADNIPLLIDSIGDDFSEEKPFSAEVYYIFTGESRQVWGTPSRVLVGDPNTGMAFLQARGSCSVRITDVQQFATYIGRRGLDRYAYMRDEIFHTLVNALIESIHDLRLKKGKTVPEIMGSTSEIITAVRRKTRKYFDARGMTITGFDFVHFGPDVDTPIEELQASLRDSQRINELEERLELLGGELQLLRDDKQQRRMRNIILLRWGLGILLLILGIGAIFGLPAILPWPWLNTHKNKLGLQVGMSIAVFGASWAVVDKNKKRKWFAFGSIVVAVIIAIIQIL